jgi:hypothetical protein
MKLPKDLQEFVALLNAARVRAVLINNVACFKVIRTAVHKNLRLACDKTFEKRSKYVIVGGYAGAFHGWPRFTGDIDIFVGRSPDNAEKNRHNRCQHTTRHHIPDLRNRSGLGNQRATGFMPVGVCQTNDRRNHNKKINALNGCLPAINPSAPSRSAIRSAIPVRRKAFAMYPDRYPVGSDGWNERFALPGRLWSLQMHKLRPLAEPQVSFLLDAY